MKIQRLSELQKDPSSDPIYVPSQKYNQMRDEDRLKGLQYDSANIWIVPKDHPDHARLINEFGNEKALLAASAAGGRDLPTSQKHFLYAVKNEGENIRDFRHRMRSIGAAHDKSENRWFVDKNANTPGQLSDLDAQFNTPQMKASWEKLQDQIKERRRRAFEARRSPELANENLNNVANDVKDHAIKGAAIAGGVAGVMQVGKAAAEENEAFFENVKSMSDEFKAIIERGEVPPLQLERDMRELMVQVRLGDEKNAEAMASGRFDFGEDADFLREQQEFTASLRDALDVPEHWITNSSLSGAFDPMLQSEAVSQFSINTSDLPDGLREVFEPLANWNAMVQSGQSTAEELWSDVQAYLSENSEKISQFFQDNFVDNDFVQSFIKTNSEIWGQQFDDAIYAIKSNTIISDIGQSAQEHVSDISNKLAEQWDQIEGLASSIRPKEPTSLEQIGNFLSEAGSAIAEAPKKAMEAGLDFLQEQAGALSTLKVGSLAGVASIGDAALTGGVLAGMTGLTVHLAKRGERQELLGRQAQNAPWTMTSKEFMEVGEKVFSGEVAGMDKTDAKQFLTMKHAGMVAGAMEKGEPVPERVKESVQGVLEQAAIIDVTAELASWRKAAPYGSLNEGASLQDKASFTSQMHEIAKIPGAIEAIHQRNAMGISKLNDSTDPMSKALANGAIEIEQFANKQGQALVQAMMQEQGIQAKTPSKARGM